MDACRAVVAEKPSVARDLAAVLGAHQSRPGRLEGNGWIVTWAIGHLVHLPEPHQIEAAWKAWRPDSLPMLPRRWPLVVAESTQDQFRVVEQVLRDPRVTEVVCATDAGREGELIFRFIYEAAGCQKPVRRLWISTLTPAAIRQGFQQLREGRAMDPLADAARGRAIADWLVGMNFSRAYTLASTETLSVGRVQTPTLAILVAREQAIRAFVPEDYLEVHADFRVEVGQGRYRGTYVAPEAKGLDLAARKRLPADGQEAEVIVARVRAAGRGVIEALKEEVRRMPAPGLYDLTELQRHANRLYGMSAQRTLEVAQALYERKKLISYPRTDSRHLSQEVAQTLPEVVAVLVDRYPGAIAPGTGQRPLGKRFVDDAAVGDHHAIIPTSVDPRSVTLSFDEARIYELIVRRLLQAWHEDWITATTTVWTRVGPDLFHTAGTRTLSPGWKVLDPIGRSAVEPNTPVLPPELQEGQAQVVEQVLSEKKTTRPPKRLTEANLLTAMETAGQTLDDQALSRAMQERGLGTPATRAAIIETLLHRGFITREGKVLAATALGEALIARVDPRVKSPALTGEWEQKLRRVERGEQQLGPFLAEVEAYVRSVVGGVLRGPLPARAPPLASRGEPRTLGGGAREDSGGAGGVQPLASARGGGSSPAAGPPTPSGRSARADVGSSALRTPSVLPRPETPGPSESPRSEVTPPQARRKAERLLAEVFGHSGYRPHQAEVVESLISGQDVLLVMPTGAGKSLCYQLPGLTRGGTTLVISPLIALMDDQVVRLRGLGLRAEALHTGRPRAEAAAVARAYREGQLDFLYVAPERLAVPQFQALLEARRPNLVAVDEAHCISQWGHDFRPEYRMLGARLPALRPVPIAAMTATATPRVQADIGQQLGLSGRRFVHGFRRTNLALEITEAPKPTRPDLAAQILEDDDRRPAILYAPTRKEAEAVARALPKRYRAAAYHAGLSPKVRDEVQANFLAGRSEVVVATIAFGMGVDKADVRTVIHLALPASVEAYYQEIGRAGRDGRPARAILLHSYADLRQHEFFRSRSYPDLSVLARIFRALGEEAQPQEWVLAKSGLGGPEFESALEKLWVHGGAVLDANGEVLRGGRAWQESYRAQLEHQEAQLQAMARFPDAPGCRMRAITAYFGDLTDAGAPCGLCDRCAPSAGVASARVSASAEDQATFQGVLRVLRARGPAGSGTLQKEAFPEGIDRRRYEQGLEALASAGLITLTEEEFERDGRPVRYRKVALTPAGRSADAQVVGAVSVRSLVGLKGPSDSGRRNGGKRRRKAKGGERRRTQGERSPSPPSLTGAGVELFERLRAWRLAEAKRRKVPAFRVATDRILLAIAAARPGDLESMANLSGVGPAFLKAYGATVLVQLRAGSSPDSASAR